MRDDGRLPLLRFHGAARTVTGSCQAIEIGEVRILVDCGLFQGSKTEKELNYRAFPFEPGEVSAVVLTHAHIDHSGLAPKLVKAGWDGPIYATPATRDLAAVMLPDSGHIQEIEVERLNRRNGRRGRDLVEPIYTAEDAAAAVAHIRAVPFETWREIAPGVRIRFWNAGHLLGSASVEMEIETAERPLRLLFSGDIGPAHKLLQHDPVAPKDWDFVVCEATYGDTDRAEVTEERRRAALKAEVKAAFRPDGALLIPSFAVERTQELLADLALLMERGEIPTAPVIIDSPLASRATEVFRRHARELEEGDRLVRALDAHHIRFTETVEQSMALDNQHGFHIVIAASGMCEAGRIRHRLKNWLWREEGTVLLVGYQAAGTLGRILAEGAQEVRIQGDPIRVRARIRQLDLYSGHADGPELAEWVRRRLPISGNVFLVHGEEEAIAGLAARIAGFFPQERILVPDLDSSWRLGPEGARAIDEGRRPPRIDPMRSGRPDWHNDWQSLLIDLEGELAKAADDRARGVVIRKIRRALEDA
ncbi:MAG: MBL fold metallo-hydrolase [Hyphomicrobiales bacterium]|nr:MBL fold metallo-hydrolase [Hyphomicrobiales bacterium]